MNSSVAMVKYPLIEHIKCDPKEKRDANTFHTNGSNKSAQRRARTQRGRQPSTTKFISKQTNRRKATSIRREAEKKKSASFVVTFRCFVSSQANARAHKRRKGAALTSVSARCFRTLAFVCALNKLLMNLLLRFTFIFILVQMANRCRAIASLILYCFRHITIVLVSCNTLCYVELEPKDPKLIQLASRTVFYWCMQQYIIETYNYEAHSHHGNCLCASENINNRNDRVHAKLTISLTRKKKMGENRKPHR